MLCSSETRLVATGWGVTRQTCWEGRDIAEEYQSVRRWFLNLNKRSAVNYRVYMRKFIHYSQLNPDQFLSLAQRDPVAAHSKMKEFWHHVRDMEGLSSKTRAHYYMALRSFLHWNDVRVGKMPRPF